MPTACLPTSQLSTHAISSAGRSLVVPCLKVGYLNVIATGRVLRVATVHDEEWLPSASVGDPLETLAAVRSSALAADLFTFAQTAEQPEPRYPFYRENDNSAIIPLGTYEDWWRELPQVARRNVRLAEKRGVVVRTVPFNDDLVHGICAIYNETPIRLGKRFWHYGKDFATVKNENSTYLDRSEFLGAFLGDALIGFIKIVYIDSVGSMMQILSMLQHQDKRTTNALIAKAVAVCAVRRMRFLKYCQFVYGDNEDSLLTDFKRRNGFIRRDHPRYYVPLTLRGRIALSTRTHCGLKALLPQKIKTLGLNIRSKYYSLTKGDSDHRPAAGPAN